MRAGCEGRAERRDGAAVCSRLVTDRFDAIGRLGRDQTFVCRLVGGGAKGRRSEVELKEVRTITR